MKYNPYSNTGRRIAALTLSLALALPLAGCSKDEKDPAASKSGTDASTSTPASTPDQSQQKEELNFAKYNTYLDMMNRVYELDKVLNTYFEEVEFQETFQLNGDFSKLLSPFLSIHPAIEDPYQAALDLVREEPVYEGLDEQIEGMAAAAQELEKPLKEMRRYIEKRAYSDDNYAAAPELHAALWEKIEPFYTQLIKTEEQLEKWDKALQEKDLQGLLDRNEMIAYNSNQLFFALDDFYELAGQDENFTADGKVVVQDVEGFVAACEQIKEDANKMLTALEDKDQRAKVKGLDYKSESSKDWSYQHYKSYKADGERVISTMDKLIELARAGGDINQQMTSLGNDHEKLIDNYNNYIVN